MTLPTIVIKRGRNGKIRGTSINGFDVPGVRALRYEDRATDGVPIVTLEIIAIDVSFIDVPELAWKQYDIVEKR